MTTIALEDFQIALHPPGSGLTELRALPSKATAFVNATDADAIERFLRAHANENVFVGVATRKDASSGKLENCAELHVLFCDIDFKDIPEAEARALIERFPLRPSIIIKSGHGLHIYWLLREPLDLQGPDDRQRADSLLRRLCPALHGDISSADPARVLRIPRTLNCKYTPPRHVVIEQFDSELRYNPCDFDDFLPEEPETENGNGARFALPEAIRDGERNRTLYKTARSCKARGMSLAATLAALIVENAARCQPPLEKAEVEEIVRKAYKQADRPEFSANNGNAGAQTSPPGATIIHLTDLGNARRLVARHGQDLRYVDICGRWLCWNGKQWRYDETGEVVRRAKETVGHMYAEAGTLLDEALRKGLAAHALKSESDGKIRAMIRLAESEAEVAATPDQFDADPWAFNVVNGTLDLRSGIMRPHGRADFITKIAPVTYDPEATCPAFTAFLHRIFAENDALIAYLQRAMGSALSGAILDHVLHILYGKGANGKTTLMNTALTIFGEYGAQAAPDQLLRKHNDPHPTEVADLRGVRFAACTEAEEGARLAEVQVKRLTGGDRLKARYMRQDFFQFDPTVTIFLSTNHRPTIKGTDFAIWRRIRLIPFMVTIPELEQDRLLAEKLKGESAGILAWMVNGCLAWQRQGLGTPPEVGEATRSYRADMDVLGEFLDSRCVIDSRRSVTAKDLYAAYRGWADEAGERSISQKALGGRLAERGFERVKTRDGWTWRGIALEECDDCD